MVIGISLTLIQLSPLGDNDDHHDEQHDQHEHIPIIHKYLSHNRQDVLVGIAEKLDEFRGHSFSNEPEINDINDIENNNDYVGDDEVEIDDALQNLVVNHLAGETVIQNYWKVGVGDDHQIKTHA